MNERTDFLQHFRGEFIKIVDRLESMTEMEAMDGLLQVQVARSIYKAKLSDRLKTIQAPTATGDEPIFGDLSAAHQE